MSEDYLAQQPTAIWNAVSGVWEKPGTANLFCAHLELYSEVWPTSGMMRDGQVFALPMPAHLIIASESLSSPIPEESKLRTPSVTDSTGGARSEKQATERGQMVKTADQVAQLAFENGLKVSPAVEASLLPTPALGHIRNYDEPVEYYLERRAKAESGEYRGMPGVSLGVALRMELLPTPNTMEHREIKTPEEIQALKERSPGGYRNLREEVIHEATKWGKFEPAIRRWEQVLGRPAPAPTKPDGKDGAHRLSSKFTEWMMGLPDGWITGHGLSRNDELKMAGNGVVPQQAELALRILLDGVEIVPAERQNR